MQKDHGFLVVRALLLWKCALPCDLPTDGDDSRHGKPSHIFAELFTASQAHLGALSKTRYSSLHKARFIQRPLFARLRASSPKDTPQNRMGGFFSTRHSKTPLLLQAHSQTQLFLLRRPASTAEFSSKCCLFPRTCIKMSSIFSRYDFRLCPQNIGESPHEVHGSRLENLLDIG